MAMSQPEKSFKGILFECVTSNSSTQIPAMRSYLRSIFEQSSPKILLAAGLALGSVIVVPLAEAKPLKVYLLAGQSNMQGHARTTTMEHIGMDPETAPLLA